MEYWWRYGSGPAGSATFADQPEAEEWLGSAWSQLRANGVEEVTLLAGENEIYGPMSLHPPA
ncbi:MAG: hypothetical protein ACRDSK_17990 [Actinophytocola sp.]|uniref:hypothetical protein n=1 Tax=Actinophytocola sp. TaxID=1872138 RepID=UPI003D6C505D